MSNVLSIVSYQILPYSSGGQKSIAQFNTYLGKQCKLFVVSTATNNIALATTYTLLPWLPNNPTKFVSISTVLKMKQLIKKENIQHIVVEHPYLGWMAFVLRWFCSITVTIHTHNIEYERFKSVGKWWWPLLKLYEKWVLTNANFVFCISAEDEAFMHAALGVHKNKTSIITFGVPISSAPTNKTKAKETIIEELQIASNTTIILFNGLLSYTPNENAVENIIQHILPLLQQQLKVPFLIVICGKGLKQELQEKINSEQQIIYKGFVSDIELYFTGADVFINPILSGGGIKTKLVEALGFNTAVVSTKTGALGFNTTVAGNQLLVVEDENWNHFVQQIMHQLQHQHNIPPTFYEHYFWGNISKKALQCLQQLG